MSSPTNPRRPDPTPCRVRDDAGFSMVEVLVSIAIIGVLVVAVLPHLLGSIKSNDVAARNTQAKTIAQAELELMRNLPYNVSPEAGDFIDVFDRYFHDLSAPATAPACTDDQGRYTALATTASGYVPAAGARCGWERSGPMYRQVRTVADNPDLDGYVVVVNTQFLSSTTPPTPVAPPAGYDTDDDDADTPPATQVGVTVTVLPTDVGVRTPVSTHTQIAKTAAAVDRIQASLDSTMLHLGTTSPTGFPVTMHAGRLDIDGSLTFASTVHAVLSSVGGFLASGPRNSGAAAVVNAPPSFTQPRFDTGDGSVDTDGCQRVCWGGSHLDPIAATAADGLPNAGTPTAPLGAHLKQPTAAPGNRVVFRPGGTGTVYRPNLQLQGLARDVGVTRSGTSTSCENVDGATVHVTAGGWLRTTGMDDTAVVDVCGTGRTGALAVLPTTFAPDGVVQVRLDKLTARCTVTGPSHTPTVAYDYTATVSRWTPTGYTVVATVTPDDTVDELAAIDLTAVQVGTYGPLSNWIESWSALTSDRVRAGTGDGARVEIPGVVTITSTPTRYRTDAAGNVIVNGAGDPVVDESSALSVAVGNLTCTARDRR